jgi:AcrR family transcriptional regulator
MVRDPKDEYPSRINDYATESGVIGRRSIDMNQAKDKRQMILDIAARIFSRYGYGKTSLDDIATEAKIAKGTIYYYFPSKEELFINVVSEQARTFMSEIQSKLNEIKGFEEKLSFFMQAPIRYICNEMPIWLDGLKSIPFNYKEHFEQYRNLNRDKMLNILTGIIKEGIAEGMVSDRIMAERLCEVLNDWFLLGDLSVMVVDFEGLLQRIERDHDLIMHLILYGIVKRG